jgi:NADH-quinone oxidoreductase subunit G
MATIHVDGKQYEVDGADNLLHACLSLGLDIPYFCWHPALGSVGACRQCAVKQYANAEDTRGRLVMSCMTPSADNTVISIDDEEAKAFRQSVVEWLMINHPHDCPVCEEGGHCHLQDMTVMTGHVDRRYRFSKRTHRNQDLGTFINHEMNRCIACYRCVRYYRDYAGGEDLGVYGAHDNVYFGRPADGQLQSEFSGNLVEVCPTGVFTDRTHSERYNRKWDMQFAPSICQQCAVGCNTSPGERYGELRRIENRYNGTVNHYFLCDRGRFGYGYVNLPDRPRQMLARSGSGFEATSPGGELERLALALRAAPRVLGVGSPRASLEANFALREFVGAGNFSCGMDETAAALAARVLGILRESPARSPSLREIEDFDAILVLGEDVTQTAPRVALALRQALRGRAVELAAAKRVLPWQAEAIQNVGQSERHPLFVVSVGPTRLDEVAAACHRASPGQIAALGFAIARAIDPSAPAPATEPDTGTQALAERIASSLMHAKRPLVVSGTGAGSLAVLDAAANVARALCALGLPAGISLALPEANSMGIALMGGMSVQQALESVDQDTAVVALENDLFRRAAPELVERALGRARTVVVIDHQLSETARRAHVVLPAATFAEGDGTLVNSEGRAQRFFQVYDPGYYNLASQVRESWRWIAGLMATTRGASPAWQTLDELTAACAAGIPGLSGIEGAAPDASTRVAGRKIARQPPRYSGRTAMRANVSVHEPRAPQDPDTALAFSMEGYAGPREPGALIPFAWAPGWNSPQAWNKFQDEVGGHLLAGDPGVRLLGPGSAGHYASPEAATPDGGGLAIAPLAHIHGSEELSARAPAVVPLVPAPYLALNPADAAHLGLVEGAVARFQAGPMALEAPVRLIEGLAVGTLGLPVGLPGMPWAPLAGTATPLQRGQS